MFSVKAIDPEWHAWLKPLNWLVPKKLVCPDPLHTLIAGYSADRHRPPAGSRRYFGKDISDRRSCSAGSC